MKAPPCGGAGGGAKAGPPGAGGGANAPPSGTGGWCGSPNDGSLGLLMGAPYFPRNSRAAIRYRRFDLAWRLSCRRDRG